MCRCPSTGPTSRWTGICSSAPAGTTTATGAAGVNRLSCAGWDARVAAGGQRVLQGRLGSHVCRARLRLLDQLDERPVARPGVDGMVRFPDDQRAA